MAKAVRQRFPYTDATWMRPANESDWLALRKADVTATDAAALFGVSPYCTPFELYHRKAGSVTVDFEETTRMRWGKRLQSSIALGICEDMGWRILNADPFLYARSPRFVGMGASPDYIVFDPKRGVGTLEIKNVDRFIARDAWADDEAPVHIEMQLQHQLECTLLPWGAIGGLIGGNDTAVYVRDRDEEVGAEIGKRIKDLHGRIRDADPPPPDFLADFSTLKKLHLNAAIGSVLDAETLEADAADRLQKLCQAVEKASLDEKAAKEDGARAKAELLTFIGDTESVVNVPGGFKIGVSTVHVDERTQVTRAYSYRNIKISKPTRKAS